MTDRDATLHSGWIPPTAPAPEPEPERQPWWRRSGGGLFAALIALLAKGKALLLLLPKIKVLTTSASMLVSIAAYGLIWGWRFGVGFVLLLLVHEMGHVIQLRREGIKASAPLFIPFLGAVVGAKSLGDDAAAEARVGLAGPILGSLGAAAVMAAGFALDSDLLRALAFTGFFLNLFNLIPVTPLDGGRAFAAMAPWMWFVGLGLLVAFAFARPNPIIVLIAVVGAFDVYRRWKALRSGDPQARAYYRVSRRQRLAVAAVYVALVALLVIGMDVTHLERTIADARA
jgi:Zn-dependent protease